MNTTRLYTSLSSLQSLSPSTLPSSKPSSLPSSKEMLNHSSIYYVLQMHKEYESSVAYYFQNGQGSQISEIIEFINPYWIMYPSKDAFEKSYKRSFFSLPIREDISCLHELSTIHDLKPVNEFMPKDWGISDTLFFARERKREDEEDLFQYFQKAYDEINSKTFNSYVLSVNIHISHRILNVIYTLALMFEETYMTKPEVSDNLYYEFYIIYKNKRNVFEMIQEPPLSFVNKMQEYIVSICKNVLNNFNQMNHLLKYRKNLNQLEQEEDAIETCVRWCHTHRSLLRYMKEPQKRTKWERNIICK